MQHELYPPIDRALAAARRFVTEKHENQEHLAVFRRELRALVVPPEKREALVSAWCERLNNSGRMSIEQACELKRKAVAYSSGHAERSRDFIASWLDGLQSATPDGNSRVTKLSHALKSALGG